MRPMSSIVACFCLFLGTAFACGGDDKKGTPDGPAGPDAAPPDADPTPDGPPPDAPPLNTAACPDVYGPASIVNTMAMAEDTTGAFDLDGDTMPDNQLGAVATLVNGDMEQDIMNGDFRLLSELRMLDDLVSDDAVELIAYSGVDTDVPANPDDDFSGTEPFYFAHESVEPLDCAPRASLSGAIASGTLTAQADKITIFLSGFGLVDLLRLRFAGDVAADNAGYSIAGGRLGGVVPLCPLNQTPGPSGIPSQLAGVVVIAGQPDIDMDGDGLETVDADLVNGVNECADGDGTVIPGSLCGCDPRMKDGYSVLFNLTSVGSSVTGPAPTP